MSQPTDDDFRLPEFRGAKIEEYEFDSTGQLVRKDRFKTSMFAIAESLDINCRREGWKCDDAVEGVDALIEFYLEHQFNLDRGAAAQKVKDRLKAINSRLAPNE